MRVDNTSTPTVLTATLATLLVALTVVQIQYKSIRRRISGCSAQSSISSPSFYSDEDGTATAASSKRFQDRVQRCLIATFSVVGFISSLTYAIVRASSPLRDLNAGNWVLVGSWAILIVHVLFLLSEANPRDRFDRALVGFGTGLLTILVLCKMIQTSPSSRTTNDKSDRSDLTFIICQILTAFTCTLLFILLPRRPDVYYDAKPVDRQKSVTFLGRLTFSWAGTLLKATAQRKSLELEDLPTLNNSTRSVNQRTQFENIENKNLPIALFLANWPAFLVQQVLLTCYSLLSFAPQIALLGILRSLEALDGESNASWNAWAWVIALGGLMILSSTFEAWMYWTIVYKISIPIQQQLSSVIFAKLLRRKCVRTAKRASGHDSPSSENANKEAIDGSGHRENNSQDVINLLAVDMKRISDTASSTYMLLVAGMKLSIACALLVSILGWASTMAGLGVSALIIPVNFYLAMRFTRAQDTLMKRRDHKAAVIAEALRGIRQIKFTALEWPWQKKISTIRHDELEAQWICFMYNVGLITIWILGPILLSVVSLAVYVTVNGTLSASTAFTAISISGSLEMSLAILPEMMSKFAEAYISSRRIGSFLSLPEKSAETVNSKSAITFESAAVAWPDDKVDSPLGEKFVLYNLNLSFPTKGLSVICGKTGAGKSLLLAAILGECDVLNGAVLVPKPSNDFGNEYATPENWLIDSAMAFVAQSPWIENASIRNNILFGLPYDPVRYRKVLFACALDKELDILPDRDLTDIGANGVNLSGGQKWRVSFARALYSRAGILVMDDIFSAVDSHTARHLYEHALTGDLGRNRTRILVTHHVALCLPGTQYLIYLENGLGQHSGTVEELRADGSLTSILVNPGEADHSSQHETAISEDDQPLCKVRSQESVLECEDNGPQTAVPKQFVEDERRETGTVKLQIYKEYLKRGGGSVFWGVLAFIYIFYMIISLGRSWWVSVWTSSPEKSSRSISMLASPMQQTTVVNQAVKTENDLGFYLSIYIGLSVLACLVGALRSYIMLSTSIRASRKLFDQFTSTVLRAPLRWLDTVPLGRLLNRFTADFNTIDARLGNDIGSLVYRVLDVVGIILTGVVISPSLLGVAASSLAICFWFASRYLKGARQIKRLESTAKSPIFEQVGSALMGLTTIRAFSRSDAYMQRMYGLLDQYAQTWWYMWLFNRWFGLRINLMGALISMITAGVVITSPGIGPSLAGFALTFALQYPAAISWSIRQYANVELDMNSMERVIEYSNVETEDQGGHDVPAAWPCRGTIQVENLCVGYDPDAPPVLKGINFSIEDNQRVGVVGRTGAGKSSLTMALFRFLKAREGRILVDGIDIARIKLETLRRRLAIIPQDPVLFSGTIRSNLDPFDEYTDGELFDALRCVHLIGRVDEQDVSLANQPLRVKSTNSFSSLDYPISEGGQNLSQGQRQLLCLARALVSRPKIMLLDEATSAVDMATDSLIQQSIRSHVERHASTLLVIAHRLSTIADFDRIVVMDAGKTVEFGSPKELMAIENGYFRSLVKESAERQVVEEIIFRQKGMQQ